MPKKIVFIGPPAAGKTTLRKFVFEGTPADPLLESAEPATIGMRFDTYDYLYSYPVEAVGSPAEKMPMELSIVDCAGQEIDRWLGDLRDKVFEGADVIFFVIDASAYFSGPDAKESIQSMICLAVQARLELAPNSQLYILAHKIDLLVPNQMTKDSIVSKIRNETASYLFDKLGMMYSIDVFPTSLAREYRNDTFFMLLNTATDLFSRSL
jgi:GTPase SAR1 family protein